MVTGLTWSCYREEGFIFLHSSIETMCLGLEMIPNATGTDRGGGSTGNKGLYARIPWMGGVWVVSSFRNL